MNLSEYDKISGLLYGFAIGDALGLGTEFMTKKEAAVRYPGGLKHYDQIIRDAHRSQFDPRDWSLDTEMLLAQIKYLCKKGGYDFRYMAETLKEWWEENNPTDAAACIRLVLREPGFVDNPLGTAQRVWKEMDRFEASNEALQRTIIMGLWPEDYIDKAMELVLYTHANSRCAACGAVIAHAAHELYYNNRVITLQEATDIGGNIDDHILGYINAAHDKDISALKLDDEDTLWYVRKAMASALWCLWHDKTPQESLDIIVAEGGDADTNAANTMALQGLRYGVKALPQQLCNDLARKHLIEEASSQLHSLITNLK